MVVLCIELFKMMSTIKVFYSFVLFNFAGGFEGTTDDNWDVVPTYTPYDTTGYVDLIADRVNNVILNNTDNDITLNKAIFIVDQFLYTVNLTGNISYMDGKVIDFDGVNRTFTVVSHNRSGDLTTASLSFGLQIVNLNLSYEVLADVVSGQETANYTVYLPLVQFYFTMNHTFATAYNSVVPTDVVVPEQEQHFRPRTTIMYAVEKVTANGTGMDSLFGEDLATWHQLVLAPLVEQQSVGLKFPISPLVITDDKIHDHL